MIIAAVSNRKSELDEIERLAHEDLADWEVVSFTNPFNAASFVAQNEIGLVLIAAELRPPTGVELLKVMRKRKPDLPAILFADTEKYRAAAKDAGADEYLITPLTRQIFRFAAGLIR